MRKVFEGLGDSQIMAPLHIGGLKLYPVLFKTNSYDNEIEFIDKSFEREEIEAFEALIQNHFPCFQSNVNKV